MFDLPLGWWLALLAWEALVLVVLVRAWQARPAPMTVAQYFRLGALALLMLAPVVSLVGYHFSGGSMPYAGLAQCLMAALLFVASFNAERLARTGEGSLWSFNEKSAALVGGSCVLVFGAYFALSFGKPLSEAAGLLVAAVVCFVALLIIGHIVISVLHVPLGEIETPEDERDKLAKLFGAQFGYRVLALGLWVLPLLVFFDASTLALANAWFALLVLAEVVRSGGMLAYYRGVLGA